MGEHTVFMERSFVSGGSPMVKAGTGGVLQMPVLSR